MCRDQGILPLRRHRLRARPGFCRTCGSIVPIATTYGAVRVPGGALDDDPGVVPEVLLFSASKAGWCVLDAARQTFAGSGPAEFWADVVRRLYG